MNATKWIGLTIAASVCLSGCNQQNTYHYLMTNPADLQHHVSECQDKTSEECNLVNQAGDDFAKLADDQASDPEAFGQRVLKTQLELQTSKHEYEESKTTKDNEKIKQAFENYSKIQEQMEVYYAVLSLTSPT